MHTPKKATERKLCVLVRTSKAPSVVYNPINVTKVTLPQDNPQRSLWAPADFFFFFHSPLFVIRCQQNFLGVQTMAFMSGVSHGPMAYRAAHSNTMRSGCKGKYTMSVCSLLTQAWVHIYLGTMSFTRKGFFLVLHS